MENPKDKTIFSHRNTKVYKGISLKYNVIVRLGSDRLVYSFVKLSL